MGFKLAELWVQLGVKGYDQVSSTIANAKKDVFGLADVTQKANDRAARFNPDPGGAAGGRRKPSQPDPLAFTKQYQQGTNFYAQGLILKAQKDITKQINETTAASDKAGEAGTKAATAELTGLDKLAQGRREAIRMQRIARTLGGAQGGGTEFAESMKRMAMAKQEEGFFKEMQKSTLQTVANMRGMSQWQTNLLLSTGTLVQGLGKINYWLTTIRQGTESITKAAGYGFAALTGGILGFVTAGLRGTAEGNRLNYLFQQISMQIASIFLPAIRVVSKVLEDLLGWFRSLSGATQNQIFWWTSMTVAVLGIVYVVGKMIDIFIAVAGAIRIAAAALATFQILATKGAAIPLVLAAIGGGLAVGYGLKKLSNSIGSANKGEGRDDVSAIGGTPESFGGTYARIQQAASQVDSPIVIMKDQLVTLNSIDNRLMQMDLNTGKRFVPTPGMRP